jgi:hypothetical protein
MSQTAVSETLVPSVVTVSVEDTVYTIAPFSMAKSVKAMSYLYGVAEAAGITDAVARLGQARDNVLMGNAPNLLSQFVSIIPALFENGAVPAYQLIGLMLTPNKELLRLEDAEESVDEHCRKLGRSIAYSDDGTIDKVVEIVQKGFSQMSNQPLMASVPNLVRLMLAA